jgi:uncharacterized protein
MTDPHEEAVLAWRARRRARLTDPEGWLSLIALDWLPEGETTVGSDPSNDVVLPASTPPLVTIIEVARGRAVAQVEAGAGVEIDGRPVEGSVALGDDRGEGPTVLRLGTVSFHTIVREGRLALRVRDAANPARGALGRLDYFPIDARWRRQARFEPYEPPKHVLVPTVVDVAETYLVPGRLHFEADGLPARLTAFSERGESDLFIVFADLTNGKQTYGGGRYLYAEHPGPGATTVIDFNFAYNPPCVFTPFATCALPLPENHLPFRVVAGEKRYRPPAGVLDRATIER